ncbi:flavin reductase family protein [Methylotenera mobilis]|uniref:Flavin reductase domain protein FMN-binding n=1 Tax=Methylotenera mobilis (strain JLW8 / ATCC BAA-1282 / DSM 17540) TaxID=583345 RepID=C6WUH6_METML|nr:flavin reductase family protein [Methylotenera mobilis]ACT47575.1 flavin reductase domain protein FMN-binding [Methylotenera mobilis JLW8]
MTSINLTQAYRLLNHGPTVLVSTRHGTQINVMAAAWNMPLDFDPPKIAIVIDKSTYTRELIEASGTFAINVPCRAQAEMVVRVGASSGRELLGKQPDNKFAAFDLPTFAASKIDAPLLEGCVAWLECKLIPEPHIQNTYDLFLVEVVAAHADERVFSDGRWHFEGFDDLRTIHHVAGGAFMAIGEAFTTRAG